MSPAGVPGRLEVCIKQKFFRAASGDNLQVLGELAFGLANGEVVPLGDIMPWQLGSHYSLSGWGDIGLFSERGASEQARTACGRLSHGEMSATSLEIGQGDEWHRAAYEHGPKWVVWKGRMPGILDSW